VCNLVASIDLSQPAISHHLGILSRAGLLARRRGGRYTHYRCIRNRVEHLAAIVQGLVA
jgi:DNA-binding transcriptional ArsR family regulator